MFNPFDTIKRRIIKNNFLPLDKSIGKYWSANDSKSLFEKNLLTQPTDWYYRKYPVRYTLNSNGYRTYEFKDVDWENSIVMFGCSMTFGQGLDDNDTVPAQLEKILNIPVINMGSPGSCILFSMHNSIILRDGYPTPRGIIMYWPEHYRTVEYFSNSVVNYGPWNIPESNLMTTWFKNKNNIVANTMLTTKANRLLWENKCPYYETSWDRVTSKIIGCDFAYSETDRARDLMHPGIKSAKKIAQKIASNLQL
jgi:hypothetical protein